MSIRDNINSQIYNSALQELNLTISELRTKLWKEDKIKIDGYTYSEWKRSKE